MKIFLIGLPGSGKTTLGEQLASALNVKFLDLDTEIESREGRSVQKIFAEKSENYFREKESKILKELCLSDVSFILATGGGAPCFFDNLDVMNKSGRTIFLDVPTSEIATRLQKTNLTERPLFDNLKSDQIKEKIEQLRLQRLAFYSKAHFTFSSDSISLEKILKRITN